MVDNKQLQIIFMLLVENENEMIIRNLLKRIRPFTLSLLDAVVFTDHVPMVIYSVSSKEAGNVYEAILDKQTKNTRNGNLQAWFPCMSNVTMEEVTRCGLDKIHVIGIESSDPKDGMLKVLFQ